MKVIIHFGFPKTMSSTLQFGLFKPLAAIGMLNLMTWRQDDSQEHLDRRPSSRLFNHQPILPEYLDLKEDKLNILSDESFTAPIKLRKNNYGDKIEDPFTFPEKIKNQIIAKYGDNVDFKAVVFIRNQPDLIYSQYVEEYNLKKYKDVDLIFDKEGEIDIDGFEIYNFNKYINTLSSVFGKDNTSVFLFEDWIKNFSEECKKLSNLLGLDPELVEKHLSTSHVNKKKKSSEGYYTKDGSVLIPFLSPEQKGHIQDYYANDNKGLQETLGSNWNLTDLKYLKDA